MVCQVLLSPELVEALRSEEPLSEQFDRFDAADATLADSVQELPAVDNAEAERYAEAGLTLKAEACRKAQAITPMRIARPRAVSMSDSEYAVWASLYPRRIALKDWNPPADLPVELTDVLAGLRKAGVFESVEVWDTDKGVGSRKGVLFVGVGGNSRYQQRHDTRRFPIARLTTKNSLASYEALCARLLCNWRWLLPAGGVLAGVAVLVWSYILCFRAPDVAYWLRKDGWWLLVGGTASLVGTGTALLVQSELRRNVPAWIHSKALKAVLLTLLIAGVLTAVGSIVGSIIAMALTS